MFNQRFLYFLTLLLIVSSCGGGGGGGSAPSIPNASITLNISSTEIYLSEQVTVSWSVTNASSCTASGSWTGSKSFTGSEDFAFDQPGSKSFTLTCQNSEGSSSSKTVSTNVLGNSQGVVVGANYISSSTVILDLNSNYQSDEGEPSTSADSSGLFELPNDPQDIISFGGSDNASGVDLTNLSLSHKASSSSSRVVSAITSLDYENSGSSDINTLLNLDSSINIYSDNPVAGIDSSSAANKYYEANAQIFVLAYSLQAFVNETNSSSIDTKTLFESLYTNIQQSFDAGNTNLSEFIETSSFIDAFIDSVLSANSISLSSSASDDISTSVSSDLKSIVKSVVEKISVRNDSSATSAIVNFATGTFLNDVIALANGSADAVRIATYSSNLNSLIASDQNIDETSLDQVITLTDDSVTTDEDNSLDFSPLTNDVIDAGSDYYGLSVSISAASNGSASLDESNNITYTPNENYFGADSLTYTVNVDGTSASANITIDVISVNDPPTFKDFVSSSSIDENTLNVLSVTVEDVEDDVIGYSLSGNDAEKLSISTSGAISFKSNPDFETPADTNADNIYEITIEASDGIDSVSDDLIITILDVENEGNPIIEGLSSQSVNENDSIGISFTVTDPQNDAITHSLSGVDKDLFTLTFDGLNASLTSSSKDYELPEDSDANNVYLVSVNFSDALNTTSQEVEISIANVNDNSPVITSSSSFEAAENQTSIGTITVTDADNDEITFTIDGTDSSKMQINSAGTLSFTSNPNFESQNSYSINVNASDGTNIASQAITVNISDVNEPPVWNLTDTIEFEYQENTFNTETIDNPEDVSDEDGDNLVYTLTGPDASVFIISGNEVSYDGSPDYENPSDADQDNVYLISVVASDGILSATSPEFRITVTNLNDNNPAFVDLPESAEVTNGQSDVFDIATSDADGDDVSVSTLGTDGGLFTVSDTNSLSFISSPDYSDPKDADGDNIYKINLQATDGERITTSNEISITVLEVNNPPTINNLDSSYSLDETTIDVVTVDASDPEGASLIFTLSGEDAEAFTFNNSATLSFLSPSDYENPADSDKNNIYNINVNVSDGFNTVSQALSISINEIPEAPEFLNLSENFQHEENNRVIGVIEVVDPEGDDFSLQFGGTDADQFTFNQNTRNLQFRTLGEPNYENPTDADGDNIYEIQFVASENKSGGLTRTLNVNLEVTDIKDTYRVSGTLFSSTTTLIDGDVPNIARYPNVTNNDLNSAQDIFIPTEVVGHIGDNTVEVIVLDSDGNCIEDPENPGFCDYETVNNIDPEDWYEFNAAPNLILVLALEGLIYEEDGSGYCCTYDGIAADLLLYDENGNLVNINYTDSSNPTYQEIILPSSGKYYAVVKADTGHSKYVLSLKSNVTPTSYAGKKPFKNQRFISYTSFADDDGQVIKSLNPDSQLNINTKLIEISKPEYKGLNIINFDLDKEFNILFSNSYLLELNQDDPQVNYLKHWKVLTYYRENYPKLNLNFDFVNKLNNFTPDPNWSVQWNLKQIGMDDVLNTIGADVQNVAVAVLDTGSPSIGSTAYSTSNFVEGFDFVNNSRTGGDGDGIDPDPTDPGASTPAGSHGTHVGTTIAAKNDGNNINGFSIYVSPMRVFGVSGGALDSEVITAMLYSAGLGNATGQIYSGSVPIRVINMSLGSIGGTCGSNWQSAINDIYDRGISIVSSSGNEGLEFPGAYGYPASCSNVVSVGAVDPAGNIAYYSTHNDAVDIAAPGGTVGTDINADGVSDGVIAFDTNEDLYPYQGTSMASPHVAGAIAVLYGLAPDLTPIQIDGFIANQYLSNDAGALGKDNYHGHGNLDLAKAVTALISDEGLDFTYARIGPKNIAIPNDENTFTFEVTKIGTGDLSVTSITSDNNNAFSIVSTDVDNDGFGSYTATLDRSSLPDGSYQSNISAELSNDGTVKIVVQYQIGPDRERTNVGPIYVALINSSGEQVVFGYLELNQSLNFFVDSIENGEYYWFFSTELDANRYIGEPGELYNYYPDESATSLFFEVDGQDIVGGESTLIVSKRNQNSLSKNISIPQKNKKLKVSEFYNQSRVINSEN